MHMARNGLEIQVKSASETGARLRQVFLLRGRARPTERGVAVGEAAELVDDIAVAVGVIDGQFAQRLAEGFEQADRLVLGRQVLGMFERQIDEAALGRMQGQIVTAGDGRAGDRQGLGVGGEGLGRSAVQVAGELIEQDQQRERAARGRGPGIEGAGLGGVARG